MEGQREPVPQAAFFVREDDADGLEEGIDYGGADELHSPPLQVLGDGIGQGRGGLAAFTDDAAVGEVPDVMVERAELLLDGNKRSGIGYCCPYLQLVAYDSCILTQGIKFR